MVDEKHHYDAHEDVPIPSYEEATSSRFPSHNTRLGPHEASDDAERQGLLGHDLVAQANSRRRNGYYHPPSVQSERSSLDDSELGSPVRDSEDAELRRELEEMDIIDAESAEDPRVRRNRTRNRFSKRFYRITNTLSNLNLPKIPGLSFGWLTSRLPSIPVEYRPGWAVMARLMGLILIISLVYMLVVSEIMPTGGGFGQPFDPEWVRLQAQSSIDGPSIEENLRKITDYDHVAGTQGSAWLAGWIEGKFKASHMDKLGSEEFYAYLNWPKKDGRRVAIVDPPELAWEAHLEEGDGYAIPKQQTLAFHGLSASGNVTGPLMYAHFGHKEDFKRLWDSGIDVRGAVVLVRYYGSQDDRAMKLLAAQNAGVAGILMYSDPKEDGFVKGKAWPDGIWRSEDGVQRGSVARTPLIVGDVLTPGQPSTKDAPRISKEGNPALPTVPSLPLSWKDAQKLLQALKGHGQQLPDDWEGGVPDIEEWWSGGEDSPKVNLMNLQEESEKQKILNVFGSFEGTEDKAKKIIVGNHRDSWCFGAADPGSGTAVMLEVAAQLGKLRKSGWRPLRTIEFASWDAGEYNMIGSTEHVEASIDELRANALAYINVDVGVTGGNLWASGSPLFKKAWMRALNRVSDPVREKSLRDLWDAGNTPFGSLGGRSDYVAFQSMAGCSSIDFGFSGPENGFPRGSCYDTFDWMANYGDPGFVYHKLLAQVWILLILELAQEPIVPFSLEEYSTTLRSEVEALHDWAEKKGGNFDIAIFEPLYNSVGLFEQRAIDFHKWEEFWYGQVYGTGGFESNSLTVQRIAHNTRMSLFETNLLDLPVDKNDKEQHGIPGREQYKHILYAPDASGQVSGQQAAVFPFVRDAFNAGNVTLAAIQLKKAAELIDKASDKLLH